MLHNNHKEAKISTITTTMPTIEKKNTCAENILETGNKDIMSLTRRPTLEQQSILMGKQRAINDEHVLATTNNNYCSNNNSSSTSSLSASISKRKNTNIKTQMLPFTQKSQKLLMQHDEDDDNDALNEVNKEAQQQKLEKENDIQKLHNNQPLIANIEHLSCQTHAHTSSNTRTNLAAYSQPYATPPNYMHTTNTLSTFKGKNSSSSALLRNSHYFSSLDNRSQRHHQAKQQQQQQQQQQQPHYIENYQHYRQKKRKQTYESLMPYSVANLPTLRMSNGSFGSSDGSSNSEEGNETAAAATDTVMAIPTRTPINKTGTTHYHMSHHKMHQQLQQQQQPYSIKQATKDNHGHYISPNQAKSSFQQQQQKQNEITSLKQNKRNKLQHRHLPNSQQERT